jgi:SAM-dependent methyltransferase
MSDLLLDKRPEIKMGFFAHDDGIFAFYSRIRHLINADSVVVDFGAGRGLLGTLIPDHPKMSIVDLRSSAKRVIGVDIDPAVMENELLDEAHIIKNDNILPFADNSVDLIFANWVLEHVENPDNFMREMRRVLKPGGWFCARTPNRWGYVGMAVTMIPNSLHVSLLRYLRPTIKSEDVFPTQYKMNSRGRIKKYLSPSEWDASLFIINTIPRYYGNSSLLFSLIDFFQRIAPYGMRTDLMVFTQKI